jgi:hypothetical protein
MASDASPDLHIVSISLIIVELADIVNSRDEIIRRLTYQSTLFPDPAKKREGGNLSASALRNNNCRAATDVCHGAIKRIPFPKPSIRRAYLLEGTTRQFRYAVIRRQCCNFSMDQAVRANVEYLASTCHLSEMLSDSYQHLRHEPMTNVSTCSGHGPFDEGFL